MPDIIVLGDINVDVIFTIPAFPTPGSEAVASTVRMHTGGSAVNTAIALAQLDMEVGFIGKIGQDSLASQALSDLKKSGVDCSHIQVDPRVSTGLIFIAVTADGERTMFSARGANAFTESGLIDHDYFANCRWVHLSSYSFLAHHQYEAMMLALDLAKNSPYTRVSLDIGPEPALRCTSQIIKVLPKLDIIFPNEMELTILSGGRSTYEALDYLLHEHGANAIVAKRGRKGSVLAVGNKRVNLPSFKVEAKDSTGAGDNFNAGVVLGRLVGLSWEASAIFGNALGALSTTFAGGAISVSRNDVFKLLESHLFHEDWLSVQEPLQELLVYFEQTH